jgi:hypothetical protein
MATREDRTAILDAYNLGVRFADNTKSLVFEDQYLDTEGQLLRRLDVV